VREAAWGNGSADKTDTAPQVDFTSPKSTNASTKPATSTHSPVPPDQPVPEIEPHPPRFDFRQLGPQVRLELQYALQCRRDEGRIKTQCR
jgi:hypothetical protein